MSEAVSQSTNFVELRDVIKLYETDIKSIKVAALRGIELSIEEGDLVAVIGPSGSGKTTLIKMIGGIEQPSSGEVRVGNRTINALKRKELVKYRRYEVGFVWQFPDKNLLARLTALKNVILPMQIAHIGGHQERIKRANELLDAVGLASRKHNLASNLSGGEAQRVALAVALANNPKLILADEPTGELDSHNAAKIIEYMQELNELFGQTFIVVTHDNRFASMTDRTYKIRDGVIHGIHRKLANTRSIFDREHLGTLDSFGTLRIPNDLRSKAKLKQLVKFKFNEEKGCLEIYPVQDNIKSQDV